MASKPTRRGLPTREQILDFLEGAEGKVGKREIARAFAVSGPERAALKTLLREMAADGQIAGTRRRMGKPGALPPVAVCEVVAIDREGIPLARPAAWQGEETPPSVSLLPGSGRQPAPGLGDRVLVRTRRLGEGRYEGRVMRVLEAAPRRLLGVYSRHPGGGGGRVRPSDRRLRNEIVIADGDAGGASPGDLVIVETGPARRLGLPQGRVVEALGSFDSPRAISTLVIESYGIPNEIPPAAHRQAAAARPVALDGRADLRALALVTIDDEDARDFDDAVFAEPDPHAANAGGWHLVVAIADVAHYVRPGDAIDREAKRRGNSVYLPDLVVPMLPEALSNLLCSLTPEAERACLACEMWIDAEGTLHRHRFTRGLMRSAARLTYRALQEDADGGRLDAPRQALYDAFRCLLAARRRRGSLDFDLPERQVLFDAAGQVTGMRTRPRFDSHRLVEEFMIAANVAAAETLMARRAPCMFRIHDQPPANKLEALRGFLDGLGLQLARGRRLTPGQFGRLLDQAAGTPHEQTVAMMVLRSQSQAEYSPGNIGHFGLNLERYAHFTSPIRRYADLLVHRSLIAALGLGEGGLPAGAADEMAAIGEAISECERRAAAAEREALDRFATRFLAQAVGASFAARVSGVTRAGVFVSLADTGAQGLVPMRAFAEYMQHDQARQRLVGSDSGQVIALGDQVEVTLREADPVTGSLRFSLESETTPPPRRGGHPHRHRRRR